MDSVGRPSKPSRTMYRIGRTLVTITIGISVLSGAVLWGALEAGSLPTEGIWGVIVFTILAVSLALLLVSGTLLATITGVTRMRNWISARRVRPDITAWARSRGLQMLPGRVPEHDGAYSAFWEVWRASKEASLPPGGEKPPQKLHFSDIAENRAANVLTFEARELDARLVVRRTKLRLPYLTFVDWAHTELWRGTDHGTASYVFNDRWMLITSQAQFASDLLHPGNIALVQDAPVALQRLDIADEMLIGWLPVGSPPKDIDDSLTFLADIESRVPRSVTKDHDLRNRPLAPREF